MSKGVNVGDLAMLRASLLNQDMAAPLDPKELANTPDRLKVDIAGADGVLTTGDYSNYLGALEKAAGNDGVLTAAEAKKLFGRKLDPQEAVSAAFALGSAHQATRLSGPWVDRPSDPRTLRAVLHIEAGRLDEARALLTATVASTAAGQPGANPRIHGEAQTYLGEIYHHQAAKLRAGGDTDGAAAIENRAIAAFDAALAVAPEARALYGRACSRFALIPNIIAASDDVTAAAFKDLHASLPGLAAQAKNLPEEQRVRVVQAFGTEPSLANVRRMLDVFMRPLAQGLAAELGIPQVAPAP